MGNIDVRVLERGDRAAIVSEIDDKITGMRELGAAYIFMSDHSIPPSVRMDDYRFMHDRFWADCGYSATATDAHR